MFAGEPDKSIEYAPPGEGTAPLAAAPNPPATEPAAPSVPAIPDIADPNGPASVMFRGEKEILPPLPGAVGGGVSIVVSLG